jgi:hypothetical protein
VQGWVGVLVMVTVAAWEGAVRVRAADSGGDGVPVLLPAARGEAAGSLLADGSRC